MKKLTVLAVALVVAFFLAPATLATNGSTTDLAEKGRLIAAFRHAFLAYWRSGDAAYDSPLRRVVDYWFRYHVAKAVLAATALLWRRFARTDRAKRKTRRLLTAYGVFTPLLAVVAADAAAANATTAANPLPGLEGFFAGGW